MTIRAALLDVDGTTVASEMRNRRAIEEVARIGGYHIQPSDWNFLAGQGDDKIWAQLVDMAPELQQVFNTASSFEKGCLNAKMQRIREVERIEETADAILLFRENGISIATVSNSLSGEAKESLRHAGYTKADFIFSLFRDDIVKAGLRPKPYPDPYIHGLKLMNEMLAAQSQAGGGAFTPIQPAECLILEDSRTGARAGVDAGMNVVQITDESPALDAQDCANHPEVQYLSGPRIQLVAHCRQILSNGR